jgi:hypothetical protein
MYGEHIQQYVNEWLRSIRWPTWEGKIGEDPNPNMYGHRICMEKTDSNISMQRLSREYSNNLIRAWLNEEDQRKRSIKPLKKIKS